MDDSDKPTRHLDRSVSDNFTLHAADIHPEPGSRQPPAYSSHARPSGRIWIPAKYESDDSNLKRAPKFHQDLGQNTNLRGSPMASGAPMELKPFVNKQYSPTVLAATNETSSSKVARNAPIMGAKPTNHDPYNGGLPYRSLSDRDKPFSRTAAGGSSNNRRTSATADPPIQPSNPVIRSNSTPLYPLSPSKKPTTKHISMSGLENDIDDIVSKIPAISKHRFLLNLAKYPGLVSIICGAYMLWSRGKFITDSQEALSIISIICGAYTFVCWVFGQVNHMTTYQAIKNHVWAKVVQSVGIVILSLGNICVVLLVIKDLKYLKDADSGTTSVTTLTTTESVPNILDRSNNIDSRFFGSNTANNGASTSTFANYGKSNETGIDLTVLCVVMLIAAVCIFLMSIAELFFGVSSIRAVTSLCAGTQRTLSYDAGIAGAGGTYGVASGSKSILKSNKVKPQSLGDSVEATRFNQRTF